jgi:Raf kinase inhibitor-like YbhB/YbcL family protein
MAKAVIPPRRRAPSVICVAGALLGLAIAGCGTATPSVIGPSILGRTPPATSEAGAMATPASSGGLILTSPAFADGGAIPAEFTCRGANVSPALAWHGVPTGTAALVLFVDDPDGRDWVHWSVLDLPAVDGQLPRGVGPSADPPQQGRNDFGKVGYGGPCPPSGNHHYRFTLYALAAPLGLAGHPDGAAVRRSLAGAKVLARVTLTGTFRA